MLDLRFRPLEKWNRQPGLLNRRAQFKMSLNRTLDLLEHEIRQLRGRDIRIEAGFKLSDIRNDGWPRGSARPLHAGVVLYLENETGSLCFPCGTYATYQDNLHAIALTLECLRAVNRYGVTVAGEQYRGFTALPAPASPGMTREQAAILISSLVEIPKDYLLDSQVAVNDAYRKGAKFAHPDTGGTPETWNEFRTAINILRGGPDA